MIFTKCSFIYYLWKLKLSQSLSTLLNFASRYKRILSNIICDRYRNKDYRKCQIKRHFQISAAHFSKTLKYAPLPNKHHIILKLWRLFRPVIFESGAYLKTQATRSFINCVKSARTIAAEFKLCYQVVQLYVDIRSTRTPGQPTVGEVLWLSIHSNFVGWI